VGFGEEYQGMSDREILVDLAGRVKGAAVMNKAQYDALAQKVDSLEIMVNKMQCPSPKCAKSFELHEDHEKRIAEQEQIERERTKKTISRRELILWAIGIVAMTVGSNFAMILSFKGG
jgi:hypothetical protein